MKKISAQVMMAAVTALSITLCTVSGCRTAHAPGFGTVSYSPEYAGGFEITGHEDSLSRVVRVKLPWQEAGSSTPDLFIRRGGEKLPEGFQGQVIDGDAERIAAMSASHVAMLSRLGEGSRIKAVSGLRFLSGEALASCADDVADIGNEADADFEKLAAAEPDIVLLYGIGASSAMEARLRSLHIPFMYVGEYLEQDPLGRAEWIVALAEIAGCREKGEEVFGKIRDRYNALKACVPDTVRRPEVMLNAPYGDVWYMASPESAMAAMIRDAGAEYVYGGKGSGKTETVDMEEAFILASGADFWLDTGSFSSIGELTGACPAFSGIRCIREGKVFNCDRRINGRGGNDFWETGQTRPDLVLEDMIRIFHPEIADDPANSGLFGRDTLIYYRQMK